MSMGVRHFWHASPGGFLSFAMSLLCDFTHASEAVGRLLDASGSE
jgi:hypothetical protein